MTVTLARLAFLLPAVTLLLLGFFHRRGEAAKRVSVVSAALSLIAVTALGLHVPQNGMTVLIDANWIPALGARWKMVLTAPGYLMLWVTAFSTLLAVAASVREISAEKGPACALHFAALFLIQTALYGVFTARDLLLFFLSYETVLIPMYLLILIWGGRKRRYAALKFLLFTIFGSLPLFVSIMILGVVSARVYGNMVFDLDILIKLRPDLLATTLKIFSLPVTLKGLLFAGFLLAFLVKIPLWPLHTWLPDAHTEAPTAGSIVLAGVLLKMGTYGLAVIALPLFPSLAREWAPFFSVLAVCGILFGALASYAQDDAKRLVAYSSVSHMGFVVLGLFSFTVEGYLGAFLQMAAHGVATGVLFYFVGALYRRRHERKLTSFGDLATIEPALTGWAGVAAFASAALPGTAGFAAEILIFFGVFSTRPLLAFLVAPAVILSASYMLKFFRFVAFEEADPEFRRRWDGILPEELFFVALCAILLVVVGVAPHGTVYSWIRPAIEGLLGGLR
ncbi:MAG: NADH-quinone oxidoreductase subunit M [Candidatus Hydrogenedentota bacterium]|nr:MAG: NADH-quinone oxidoreductase subunit M [Candidatus Hydrogenedentota bacterium]